MNKQEENRKRAVVKARYRGEVAKEWFKTNKLTKETKPEFDKLMKQANKNYEANNE